MSSASSAVTYTSVYTDSEPGRVFWGVDEELSDGELIYPEYIPLEDEHILSAEEQPLPPVVSPTAESLWYVTESDPEEDPKEYEEDKIEDGPSEQPPSKRLCLSTLGSRYKVGESSTRGRVVDYGFANAVEAEMRYRGIGELGYGIRGTWIDPTEAVPEMATTTLKKVNTRVTQLVELHEHDTQDLYALLEDAQDVWIVEEEAYAAREAWAQSVGLSQTVHHELQILREQVYAQEYQLQTHQAQLQLQSTLIQSHQQLHETHSQMQ
nr:hypothetical protein [Tanacetum cinerariifolium]